MSCLASWHLPRMVASTFYVSPSALVMRDLIRVMLKSVLSRVPLILSKVFLYCVITSSAASLYVSAPLLHLLKVPHSVLLWVLVDALHTHQLVASEAEFLEISISMLSTNEGVHGL